MLPGSSANQDLFERVRELGPWFHNLRLEGCETAPNHFLGDYPRVKWERFAHVLPEDLTGMSVLDIGCNAGFYSFEMKRRGATRVVAVDSDDRYLDQARFAAEVLGFRDIAFANLDVYQVAEVGQRFDLVLFMGVLYHLRYPLLALDLLHRHVVGELLLFQSMQRGSEEIVSVAEDCPFEDDSPFDHPGYPRLHFIEHRYASDPTNWWIPNRAAVEAMLRSAGFAIEQHPEPEVYLCRRKP